MKFSFTLGRRRCRSIVSRQDVFQIAGLANLTSVQLAVSVLALICPLLAALNLVARLTEALSVVPGARVALWYIPSLLH